MTTFRVLTYSLIVLAATAVALLGSARTGLRWLGVAAITADVAVVTADLVIGFTT